MISVNDYGKKFIVTDNISKEKIEIKKLTGAYDANSIKDLYKLSFMYETKNTGYIDIAHKLSLLRIDLFFNSCKLGDFESCKKYITSLSEDNIESVFMYGMALVIRHNGKNDTLNSFLSYELNK